ncbi:MAG: AAA family ATPase [Paludibacteraceae bacterium]|nr:AAA family ATPase [Paludibacteraceae bacterium]
MNNHPTVDVERLYQDLKRLCETIEQIPPYRFYTSLRRLFFLVLDNCTKGEDIAFAGPIAKMDFLCKKHRIPRRNYHALKQFRAKLKSLSTLSEEELRHNQLDDIRILSEFFSGIFHKGIPAYLNNLLPEEFDESPQTHAIVLSDCIRVVVNDWDDRLIHANRIDDEEEEIQICYAFLPEEANRYHLAGDLSYIGRLLSKNCRLNLIRPKLEDGVFFPEFIIYEPDFLIDISTIAESFEEYGLTPLSYLIKRLKPKATSQPILIGNLAGQFLDEAVYNESPSTYKESVTRFFRQNALSIVTCPDFNSQDFHKEAMRQQRNLSIYTQRQLDGQRIFDPEKTLLEPSFFCEMLGLQGRMDLLHDDKRLLIEQKSGKWGYPNGGHQEKHYVQMLFYLAWIKYNQRISTDEVNALLLYSKYPTEGKSASQENGLIKEGPAPKLLFSAIQLRNQIAHLETLLLQGKATLLERITADDLNVNQKSGPLWERFQRPEIEQILQTIKGADSTEKAYFFRFFSFMEREYHLSKNGFAQAWNTSMEERAQDGSAYFNLQLEESASTLEETNGIEFVHFNIDAERQTDLPNFRKGDIVVCYPYRQGESANLCDGIVFRATLTELSKERLSVKLRAPQRNKNVFRAKKGYAWALEHDFIDSSFAANFKDLFSFLSMRNDSRKDLILNRRPPLFNHDLQLSSEYGSFNELVLKAKQAEDYFLVIGPPGTGKTSFALVNIMKETLASPNTSVLLTAYTNRAVEEICSKLIKEGIDFIRIGHEHACSEAFDTSYLLKNKTAHLTNSEEIKKSLLLNRVYVGTIAAIASSSNLFELKHFDLAIVDEASQILEPQLIGLLTAGNGHAIRKFVLIGDQKQLPAVVQQTEKESEVASEELRAIGLSNCRNSFFERLLNLQNGNEELVYMLNRQGRMHPDISDYINREYYAQMLTPVPLPHQEKELFFDELKEKTYDDPLQQALIHHRLLYFHVSASEEDSTDNVNRAEAKLILEILQKTRSLYQEAGKTFNANTSIGIIVPYRAQIATIRQELERSEMADLRGITIDTVERYQGSEREIIIYGTTIRTHSQLDFLAGNIQYDGAQAIDRKLNVAITRAKEMMIVIGDSTLLQETPSYRHFIQYLKEKGDWYKG